MCWIGANKGIATMGETAVEDIIVYKVMRLNDGGLYSFTRNFAYVPGKEHCLWSKIVVRDDGDRHVSIERGFHSYGGDCVIVARCIIPKGSIYFKNKEGEFVPDRIVIINYCGLGGKISEKPVRFDVFFSGKPK